MTTADFETFDKDAISEITAKAEIDKIDHTWADRISTLPVGHGFRAKRDESETVRMFKRRIGAAARFVYRELEWFPDHKNVKPINETSWVVKVRSLNVKAQAEDAAKAAMSHDGREGTQEATQPTGSENRPIDTPTENEPVGPRRARAS
jgi:hypothetical protein